MSYHESNSIFLKYKFLLCSLYLCHLDSGPEPSVRLYQPGPAYRCELAGRENAGAGRTITLAGLAPREGHGRPGKHFYVFCLQIVMGLCFTDLDFQILIPAK